MRACVLGVCSAGAGGPGCEPQEILLHQRHQPLVRQVPGGRHQQVGRRVHAGVIAADHVLVEALHRLRRAQNRLAQRVVFPEIGREDLVDQVVGAVRLHLDLFQDDALFLLDILVAEQRVQHQVGQHVESLRQVLVQHLGVETDQFLGGEGVQIAADRIHRARDILGGPAGGALEQHVLDEVRDAVLFAVFAPRTRADPDAHGDGTHVRHGLGDDAHAVCQRSHFDISRGGDR